MGNAESQINNTDKESEYTMIDIKQSGAPKTSSIVVGEITLDKSIEIITDKAKEILEETNKVPIEVKEEIKEETNKVPIEVKEEIKDETNKVPIEVKEEIKEETNKVPMEETIEVKEEIKEEAKEEIKEEAKEEVKEEVKEDNELKVIQEEINSKKDNTINKLLKFITFVTNKYDINTDKELEEWVLTNDEDDDTVKNLLKKEHKKIFKRKHNLFRRRKLIKKTPIIKEIITDDFDSIPDKKEEYNTFDYNNYWNKYISHTCEGLPKWVVDSYMSFNDNDKYDRSNTANFSHYL